MTSFTLARLSDLCGGVADTIIDVRSPAEFAEDHLPGAVNLPVLSNAERAEIGTLYTRVSPFDARKRGGAMVARNTAVHLLGPLAGHDGGWQPLVYCWRGGQRSGAFATILDQVGWRVRLLEGGYRSYRRLVVDTLYRAPLAHRLRLLDGGTGTAKTRLLHFLAGEGAQVLDLEGLAAHRGSLFGATGTAQPAQKMFETRIAATLATFDPARPVWVEAESSKIGERTLPPSLWSAMQSAPRWRIEAPLAARARHLCTAYADLVDDAARLHARIDCLRPYHACDTIAAWHSLADAADWPALAQELIGAHYDPRYAKSTARSGMQATAMPLPDLGDATLTQAARDLHTRVS